MFYPENINRYTPIRRTRLEMSFQIIAGVRDTWTLTDDECLLLNFYTGDRTPEAFNRLRREVGLAKKAACCLVADELTREDD